MSPPGRCAGPHPDDDGEAEEARIDGQGGAPGGRPRLDATRGRRPGRCRRPRGGRGGAVPRRPTRRGGAGCVGAGPACPVRLHAATDSRVRRRQPVPVGRRAPRRRPPAGPSPLHADRPPVHATAVRRPRVPRAPVQRDARRSRLRRRVRLRPVVARVAGTRSDRCLAVWRLRTVLVAGHHSRGLHPQCSVVLRHLRAGAVRRPGPATRMAACGSCGGLGGRSRQPLALVGAGNTRAARGATAGSVGCAGPSTAAARGGPPDRRDPIRVDGLAVSAGSAHQLLRLHRHGDSASTTCATWAGSTRMSPPGRCAGPPPDDDGEAEETRNGGQDGPARARRRPLGTGRSFAVYPHPEVDAGAALCRLGLEP